MLEPSSPPPPSKTAAACFVWSRWEGIFWPDAGDRWVWWWGSVCSSIAEFDYDLLASSPWPYRFIRMLSTLRWRDGTANKGENDQIDDIRQYKSVIFHANFDPLHPTYSVWIQLFSLLFLYNLCKTERFKPQSHRPKLTSNRFPTEPTHGHSQ